MRVVIVKYNGGNTASVANAMARLGVEAVISDDPQTVSRADKIIFPGVGEASTAMSYLRESGLFETIKSLRQPVLGICLGMQLMCESSEENEAECLSIIPYRVRRFSSENVKVPHVGWNVVRSLRSPLFDGIDKDEHFYFVHGYFVEAGEETTATCFYDQEFSAAVQHKNFFAVQFHPEKSGVPGQRILENFLNL